MTGSEAVPVKLQTKTNVNTALVTSLHTVQIHLVASTVVVSQGTKATDLSAKTSMSVRSQNLLPSALGMPSAAMCQPVTSAIVALDLKATGSRNVEISMSAKDQIHVVTKRIAPILKEVMRVLAFRDILAMLELVVMIMMNAWRIYVVQELFAIIQKVVIDAAVHQDMLETHIPLDALMLMSAHTAIPRFVECDPTAAIFLARICAAVQ